MQSAQFDQDLSLLENKYGQEIQRAILKEDVNNSLQYTLDSHDQMIGVNGELRAREIERLQQQFQ